MKEWDLEGQDIIFAPSKSQQFQISPAGRWHFRSPFSILCSPFAFYYFVDFAFGI